MPRPSKGPHLRPKKGKGRQAMWIIRDGERDIGTGCLIGKGEEGKRSFTEAEKKLQEYIAEKHDPKANRGGDLVEAAVADALSVYMSEKIDLDPPAHAITEQARRKHEHRRRAGIAIIDRLNKFFGEYFIPQLNGKLSRAYATQRGSQSSARRELEVLQAAVNYFVEEEVGGVQTKFRSWLPDPSQPRERWLTRSEAARLIWAAWRLREDRGGSAGRFTSRHIARFILVGLYTGTRASGICGAALTQAIGRGHVDLEHGIFVRKAMGAKETNKRQPTIPLPPRLLAHMRRWHRLGISKHSVIEWQGEPVERVSKGWLRVREASGLDDQVIPHTLRHTAITWYLRSGKNPHQVSDYCGVSMQIINKHYKHHMPGGFDDIMSSSARLGR
jgi:integrase